ncbi:BA75_02494T0 [Komagataella pastoris]|uniref:BA75_02494T0 n=1 Tax=Komagataella pastoris TaxID=4922 RepID=A0A1B2JCW3_PICPA|nr:BA75_02494T0 [Komagataella pastoris]
MISLVTSLWESVFTPGTTPALVLSTHLSFLCLSVTLISLIFINGSIHFVNLLVIALLLWGTVTWFIGELEREKSKLKSNEQLQKESKADQSTTEEEENSAESNSEPKKVK